MEIDLLHDIRNNDPKYKKWVSAVAAFNQGDYQTAISITEKIANEARQKFNLGIMNQKLGNLDLAIRHFTETLKQDKFMAIAWFCRGVCFHLAAEFLNGGTKSNVKVTNAKAIIASKDKESLKFLQSAILDYSKAIELLFTHTYSSTSILDSAKSPDGVSMTPLDGIDYRQLGLNYVLTKVQILFNRALAFSSFGLYHRSRDDLILAKSIALKKENNTSSFNSSGYVKEIDRLLNSVNDSLKSMPVSMLIYSPSDKSSNNQLYPSNSNSNTPTATVPIINVTQASSLNVIQSTNTSGTTPLSENGTEDTELETDIDTFVYKLKHRPTVDELMKRNIIQTSSQSQKH